MTEAISAKVRDGIGSGQSKKLRASGRVPAVIYGHHSEPKVIDFDLREVQHLLSRHGVGATVNVDVQGENVFTMLKEVQKNHLKNQILHMDLQELTMGESVRVSIPLHFVGKSDVEDSVMIVVEQVHSLDIEVLPKDLVEHFEIDVRVLKDKPMLTIGELSVFNDERYTVFADADTVVASLTEGGSKEPEVEETDEIESIVSEVVEEAASEEE